MVVASEAEGIEVVAVCDDDEQKEVVLHVHAGDADASLEHMFGEDWAMYQDGQELPAESVVCEEPPLSFAADDNNADQYVHWAAVDNEVDAPQFH